MTRRLTNRPITAIALLGMTAALLLVAACGAGDGANSSAGSGPGTSGSLGDKNADTIIEADGDGSSLAGRSGEAYDASQSVPAPGGIVAAGEGAPPPTLPSQLDRKIVRVATLKLSTEEVSQGFEEAGAIASAYGGYIASSTFGNDGDSQTASFTIKVPAAQYQDAINRLRQLGDVREESSNANDVTEEYTDLQSRLRNLRAVEAQYVEFLGRAEDINSVLQVQDRLNSVRMEIEQVQGRIQLLDHTTEMATITVHLTPPLVSKEEAKPGDGISNPREAAEEAFDASLALLLGAATVIVMVGAFSWWLVPVAVVAFPFVRRAMRANRAAAPPAAPTAPAM
ncbi:MAG: DUF4349 domain-containing protein [Dehalococcoidia bacterium]